MNEKKVREAIYCMKSFADDTVCEECDNYDRCDHTMVADNARTAIEALEKQLPKKPIEYEDKYYACPICGMYLCINMKNTQRFLQIGRTDCHVVCLVCR